MQQMAAADGSSSGRWQQQRQMAAAAAAGSCHAAVGSYSRQAAVTGRYELTSSSSVVLQLALRAHCWRAADCAAVPSLHAPHLLCVDCRERD